MTVRRRLATSVVILLLLSAGSALLAVVERQRAAQALAEIRRLQQEQQAIVSLARGVDLRLREMRVLVAVTPTPSQIAELRRRLRALDAEARNTPPSLLPQGFDDAVSGVRASWTSVLASLDAGRPAGDPVEPDDVLVMLDAARAAGDARMSASMHAFLEGHRSADRSAVILILVSVVCGVAIVIVLSLTLRRGLETIEDASRHMGQGDYTHRIQVHGDDEFARAARTFNAMADALAAALGAARTARAAAEEASAVKSRLLAALSHDLRTPLTAVLGVADLIEDDVRAAGLTPTLADLAQLRHGVAAIDAMVGELLELARLESGKLPVQWHDVDVAALAADVAAGVRPLADRRGNALVVAAPEPLRHVTDGPKLRHVLQNLIGNANKFTERGTVTVVVARWVDATGQPGVEVSVADTGIGMTAEEVSRIFEPFQQANASVSERFGGTGLGLAIARGYVAVLEGTIDVSSAPGKGTTFVVRLPQAAAIADEVSPAAVA